MDTDNQILELVKTGKFTLPVAAEFDHCGHLEWVPKGYDQQFGTAYKGYWRIHSKGDAVPRAMVYDLCAMHFARELDDYVDGWASDDLAPNIRPVGWVPRQYEKQSEFEAATACGDSAAAIAALYGAVCA